MDEETRAWLSGGEFSSPPPPRVPATKTTPLVTYNPTEFKTIGQQCARRLPPANAVQAMFLYEMQRQTEEEQLFTNQMFRLARSEDASTAQQRRIEELEAKMLQLEKSLRSQDVEVRLATSKSTMQMLGEKLKVCGERVEGMDGAMRELGRKVEEVELAAEKAKEERRGSAVQGDDTALVNTMKEEIDVLFDDRDGILGTIKEIIDRMASLAPQPEQQPAASTSTITNGTPQQAPPPAPTSANTTTRTAQTQRLPIRTTSTTQAPLNLSVPKGKAHVGLKGSAHAPPPVPAPTTAVRSFSPGKPWAS